MTTEPSNSLKSGETKTMSRKYFGSTVRIHRSTKEWHPYPYTFDVIEADGTGHRYRGIPNYCETMHQAIMRAWYRCKWIFDGSICDRYEVIAGELPHRTDEGKGDE